MSSTRSSTDGGAHGDATDRTRDAAGDPALLAAEAFVWGFPLVVTQRTMQKLGGIVDTLFNQTALSTAALRVIVAPNQDTLYSVSVLDLRSEPMVLTVPDVTDRYWTYQFLEAWTNSFHYIGTRATSGKGGRFVVTPPGFTGTIPAGMEQIASPTPEMFLLGRYLVKSTADISNVTTLARTLVPLHTVTGDPAPPASPALGSPPGDAQKVGLDGAAFFDELGDALASNPPYSDHDKAELARFSTLGVGPGLHPTATARAAPDGAALSALETGVTSGLAQIQDGADGLGSSQNGWTTRLDIGTYGDDVLLRAVVAKVAWAANVPAEAVYPISRADSSGQAYTGAKSYVVHFDAGNLPPVKPGLGFWSMTLYDSRSMFFVENTIQRYAIGDRTPNLAYNADGSLDLYIQSTAPAGHEANWLPSPTPNPADGGPSGEFVLVMRLYLPEQVVLDGNYTCPAVTAQ